ncbi:hypothetical protein CEE44_02085 [Candidatus Woesearchaeota archaeon B3_Woes]|nr:MAG: hypothetical protein CEE44_02085 [Candidatus Woesearchaeota archaeon B3_Woes]
MKTKLSGLLTIFLIGILTVCGVASATITINDVLLDSNHLGDGTNTISGIERGDEYQVKVRATSNTDLNDVQIEAYIRGYDHDDRIEDITDVFDMKANVTYTKKLTLSLPQRMDQDRYKLRVRVEGRGGEPTYNDYDLEVDTGRHNLVIKDVVFSPEGSVKAGRALLASVRLKNYGEKDEEGIKVKVSVPDLGVSASDYIDELEADESTTSEEIYLRVPSCAAEGTYDVKVEVTYDDADEKEIEMAEMKVISGESCEVGVSDSGVKPTITYDSSAQEVTKEGAIYTLTISNPTNSAKTVTVGVNGVDVFGSVRVSPSNVFVLGAGETKTVYLYVTANKDAVAGQHSFSATVSGLGTTTQEILLTANIITSAGLGSVKKALEVGLVVLVVVLVVVGLIIGFRKLNSDEDDMEEEGKTYY